MNKILSAKLLLLLLCVQSAFLQAREPYHALVTVAADSATVSAPNMVDLSRDLKSSSITELIPFYTPTSAVSIDINLRGIDAISSFAANSTTLVVAIPQAGITQSFTGTTRDDSIKLFKDFVHDGGTKHRLLRAYAKYSPIDPIAGNPISLMAQMAKSDYLLGQLSPLSGCDCSWNTQPIVNQFQTGLDVTRAFAGGFETTSVTIPLRYSYSPNLDWAFIIDLPITYNRNGGASSLFNSLGLAIHLPITHEWSLTPLVRFGSGGTLDLCTAGCFFDTGITSVYHYKFLNYVLTMTNTISYYTTTNFWLTGINFNYHLQNYVFKNGLSLVSCKGFTFCNRPLNFGLSVVDSYFASHLLYIQHYDEVGISVITNNLIPYFNYDSLSLGFAYQFGEKSYRGYNFNMIYQF